MTNIINHLFALKQIDREKAFKGMAVLSIHTAIVFLWASISAPIAISPAGGAAIALLFLFTPSYWPTIFLGTLFGMAFTEASVVTIFTCAISYTFQAFIGAFLLHTLHMSVLISRLRDSLILIGVLVSVATIFPSMSFAMEYIFGANPIRESSFFVGGLTWSTVWIATMFSNLLVTPLILRWSVRPHKRNSTEKMEAIVLLLLTSFISGVLFWSEVRSIGGVSLAYLIFIPLFWASLRLGPRMTITALFISALIALFPILEEAFLHGLRGLTVHDLFQIELFYSMLAIIFIFIASIEEERKEKTKELEAYVSGLRTEIRELSDDDRLKNEFIATLAHELRNPLAPVVSTLELLRMREELSTESLHLIRRVQHQTETVKRLLDDLLDVSRITQKKFKLRKERCSLKELICHCKSSAQHIMSTYDHSFVVNIPDVDVPLYVDPTRLEQIVLNLLYNAAKYTEPGGRVELTCTSEGNHLTIRLKDNGIGIDPRNLEQIFLPFTQLRNKKHTGTGLGIGLAITKQLVEMHEGTISAYSAGIGTGSEFTVTLPIIDREEREIGSPADDEDVHYRTKTILIVDDNEAAAKALLRLLEYRGHRVYVAHSGTEAIENARLFKPETILLDIGLPDLSGYEVSKQLRQNGFKRQIIAVTGYGQADDRAKGHEAGFDHHLVKPVSLAEVEKLL